MATTGQLITKSTVIADFQSYVVNTANSGIVWNASSHPSVNGGAWSNDPAVAPADGDLPTMIAATALRGVMRDFAYQASRIRKVRAYNSGCWDSGTQVSNLTNAYVTNYSGFDNAGASTIFSGNLIKAADWNQYMADLQAQYNVARNSTTTFATCHCSCHSSCHGSRGRR